MNEIVHVQPASATDLASLAPLINAAHAACNAMYGSAIDKAIETGGLLVRAKEACQHGQWLPWLARNVQFKEESARTYMTIFNNRHLLKSNPQRAGDLSIRGAVKFLTDQRNDAKLIPANGEQLYGIDDTGRMAFILHHRKPGFYHVAVVNPEAGDVQGSKRAISAIAIPVMLKISGFTVSDATWLTEPSERKDYNPHLFTDHQDYVDQVILGNAA